jgi:hypothetical protein
MARHRKDLGARKHVRVDLYKPGFLIPAPDAPWIECVIVDVSNEGACLEVGGLTVPELFGLAFTAGGEVLRVCTPVWRRGEHIGARFLTAKELRLGPEPPTLIRSRSRRRGGGTAPAYSSFSPASLPLARSMKWSLPQALQVTLS